MFCLLLFLVLFCLFYFIYSFIFENMLKKEKYTKIQELVFLTHKFQLDKKKMSYKKCLNGVAILNAFIISFTISIVRLLPIPIMFTLVVAFMLLMLEIFIGYMGYGRYLQKKWGKNNGK